MFVRIQSWDENEDHRDARRWEGKKVRVTIEEIDEIRSMPDVS